MSTKLSTKTYNNVYVDSKQAICVSMKNNCWQKTGQFFDDYEIVFEDMKSVHEDMKKCLQMSTKEVNVDN